MPTSLSPVEIMVILVVALIVLGPKRLPEAGRQVGRAIAQVRRWSRGIQNEIRDALDIEEEPPRVASDAAATERTDPMVTSGPPPLAERPPEGSEPPAPNNGADPADEPSRP